MVLVLPRTSAQRPLWMNIASRQTTRLRQPSQLPTVRWLPTCTVPGHVASCTEPSTRVVFTSSAHTPVSSPIKAVTVLAGQATQGVGLQGGPGVQGRTNPLYSDATPEQAPETPLKHKVRCHIDWVTVCCMHSVTVPGGPLHKDRHATAPFLAAAATDGRCNHGTVQQRAHRQGYQRPSSSTIWIQVRTR